MTASIRVVPDTPFGEANIRRRGLPGFTPDTVRPLVSSRVIPDAEVAETLLILYSLNNGGPG